MKIKLKSKSCKLKNCPIGLFMSKNGELCLKTEYGVESYIVSSGERFWGGAKNQDALSKIIVTPCEVQEDEIFNNPPLKFEELEKGMWVWDNFFKKYFKIFRIRDWEPKPYLIMYGEDNHIPNFEDGRFYRYEVKKDGMV